MKYFALFIYVLSFNIFADTCLITESMKQEYNALHGHKVNIETSLDNTSYFVTINLPDKIENEHLNAVLLVSDNIEDPTLIAPLEVFHEGEQLVSWYKIDAGYMKKHFVVVSFGEACNPSITREVFYE